MSCQLYWTDDHLPIIVCSRAKAEKRVKCAFCGRTAKYYCDYPIKGGTCSKPLCDKCRTVMGEEQEYCPRHAADTGLFSEGRGKNVM